MSTREHSYWIWSLLGLLLLLFLALTPEAIDHFVADVQAIQVDFIHFAVALCGLVLFFVIRTLVEHLWRA